MTTISTTGPAPHPRSRLRSHRAGGLRRRRPRCAGLGGVQPLPRLIYNPSDSVPVGWYRVQPIDHRAASLPRRLEVGSIVLTRLPADAAALAAQRGYLPAHVPLLKRVGAVAPQHVCIVARQVRIDGVPTAAALPADRLGRPLPSWQHCRPLAEGELFLLSVTNPASFDSRYFAGQRIRRDRRRASGQAGDTPMTAADSLHVAVPLIVPSGMPFRLLPPCRRACSAAQSRRASRNIRRSRPPCRRLASNAPDLRPPARPSARSPAGWLQAAHAAGPPTP